MPQAVTVNLLTECSTNHCLQMAWQLQRQLSPRYTRSAALLELDSSYTDYLGEHRTARRRAARARRLGYLFDQVDRPAYADDIHEVNTSKRERQGREMTAGYLQRGTWSPNPLVCERHHVYTYAVLEEGGALCAYLWLYRSGELAMVSSILGHADHLENGVMYLLFLGMLREQYDLGGAVFYNLWHSGTDGLRFFKERVGLRERHVKWTL